VREIADAAQLPELYASKVVTRLVVGDIDHGRTYSYSEL